MAGRKTIIGMAAGLVLAAVAPAFAADVTFVMRNDHPNAVEVELYSQDRDYVWPGNNQVFYLNDGETKQIPLSCEEGEKICYGAWIEGDKQSYWGVGPENAATCDDCCYTCEGGQTEQINLTE
ncbi:hypothetical protein DFO46_3386 [Rhizobium sp. AG855]|nr:hypothetical protein DFO46_3386 [Rhizobium sp. AG855]